VISLVDRPELTETPLVPLPLALDLESAPAAILHLQQNPELIAVSDDTRHRALLIMRALAEEADRRHHHVTDRGSDPGIEITIRDVPIAVLIAEEQQKVMRVSDEDRDRLKYDWQRATPVPVLDWTGRLAITLSNGQTHRPTFADRKRWRLEDKLPLVLEAAEQWADEIIAARERDAQAKRERRRQWDEALAKARRAYLDQINRDRLDRQLDSYDKAQRLRAFAEAVEAKSTQLPESSKDRVAAWAAWIRGEADRLDPALQPEDLAYLTPDTVSEYEVSKYMPRGTNAYRPPD
jgi:hypothetical protein